MQHSNVFTRPLFSTPFSGIKIRPGVAFYLVLVAALAAFELFNYSTTDYALRDLLGDLKAGSLPWATILTAAFCAIDVAGLTRLFAPSGSAGVTRSTWFLFGAWFLAATMNVMLTWWGLSVAISDQLMQSASVLDGETLAQVVPVAVALTVWVIRILIIGSLTQAIAGAVSRPAMPAAPAPALRALPNRERSYVPGRSVQPAVLTRNMARPASVRKSLRQ